MDTTSEAGQAKAGRFTQVSYVSAGTQALGHLLLVFLSYYQGAESQVEQPGLDCIWDANAVGSCLPCCATALVPK